MTTIGINEEKKKNILEEVRVVLMLIRRERHRIFIRKIEFSMRD